MLKFKLIVGLLAILWLGMLLGIGLESIVKFNTPTLTKPVAFDVGRTVFAAFNQAQIALLLLMLILTFFAGLSRLDIALIATITLTLILQVFWLFPLLSQHVDMILSGNNAPGGYHHALYGILEIIKLMALLIIGVKLLL